jgi:hypothetical protein
MAKRKMRVGQCKLVRTANGSRRLCMTKKGPRFAAKKRKATKRRRR